MKWGRQSGVMQLFITPMFWMGAHSGYAASSHTACIVVFYCKHIAIGALGKLVILRTKAFFEILYNTICKSSAFVC